MTDSGRFYNREFFLAQKDGSKSSALKILPTVLELLGPGVESVVDIGCGVGTWLAVAQILGVKEVAGVDGPHVDRSLLQIPEETFTSCDLAQERADERLARSFDLAICLETAEHLPSSRATTLIDSLTNLSRVVLFSAAIPFQPGDNHIHCAWQSYWASLFSERDFVPLDVVRPKVWIDREVEWWYAQNCILYIERRQLSTLPHLGSLVVAQPGLLDIVHPRLHERLHTRRWGFSRKAAGGTIGS